MSQPELFSVDSLWDSEPPSVAGSTTSIAAAKAIEPVAGAKRRAVWELILASGNYGVTDEEGCDSLGFGGSTYRPRRRELQLAGYIRDSGRTRKTKSGTAAVVWVVTEAKQ